MKYLLIVFVYFQFYTLNSQVIWSADPDTSTNPNSFFRRLDRGNYPQDYCYVLGDEQGVEPSNVTTIYDSEFGKVWKVIKPKNRKRAEFARTEGDINYFAPKEGDDIYIAWRWKISSTSTIKVPVAVWQWKGSGTKDFHQNYPLSMAYDGDLTLNAFGPDWYGGNFPSNRKAILWRKTVPQDTWVSFVIHIKLSKLDKTAKDGFVEFWFNGVKQTLNEGTSSRYKVDLSPDSKTAYHRTNDGTTVYPKWGVYNRNSCAFEANAYFDEMKITRTLNDAVLSTNNYFGGEMLSGVKAYPIPAIDVINIIGAPKNSQVSIFDITGRLVKNTKLTKTNPEIEISKFPKGLYFLKINKGASYKIIKFIKNHN